MSGLGFEVVTDLSGLEESLGDAGIRRAQRSLTERVMQDMDTFVPKRTGALRGGAYVSGDDEVAYPTYYACYAHRHHGRDSYANPTTAGTFPKWERHAEQAHMSEWCDHVARLLGGKG